MGKRFIIFFIALSLFVISFYLPQKTNATSYTQKELEENLNYREEMGLNSNLEHVKSVLNGKGFAQSKNKHGVLLTEEELAEVDKRISFQAEKVPKIIQYIETNIDVGSFGGIYVNQKQGGIIYIGLSKELKNYEKQIDDIIAISGDKTKVKFIKVAKTEKQLDKIHESVLKEKQNLASEGIKVLTVSTNLASETVDVGVENLTEVAKVRLIELFGSAVHVFSSTPGIKENRGAYTRPLIGGLEIYNADRGSYCSGGFSAAINGSWYYITAGHCGNSYGSFMQGGSTIGGIVHRRETGNIDALSIYNQSHSSNKVYNSSNLTKYDKNSSEYVGQYVCKSGITTGNTCGNIKSTNYSAWSNTDLTAASYSSNPGDSGGTVYNSSTLKGIHTGRVNGYALYTQVENIMNAFGAYPRLY